MLSAADAIRSMTERLAARRQQYDRAAALQEKVLSGQETEIQPLLLSASLDLSDYPDYTPKQVHYDPEKMLCQGLRTALCAAEGGRECVPSVRANMGCGIVLALFGLKQELFDDKMPWLQEHLPRERILEMKPSDLSVTPEFAMAMEHMEYMADRLRGTGVRVYPLDIQGAVDTAHLLMGDDMFYELYDDEEYMDHALSLCEAAIRMAMDECLRRIPDSDRAVCHYSAFSLPRSLGAIKMSEDTTTLIRGEHIARYAVPAMTRLLAAYGGGYIHYCGRNDALFEAVLAQPQCLGLNFGNPEKHDMAEVLSRLARARKVFMGPCSAKNEIAKPYFMKALRNSWHDGKNWLLLQYACPPSQVAEISALWDESVSSQRESVK